MSFQQPSSAEFVAKSAAYLDAKLPLVAAYSPSAKFALKNEVLDVLRSYPGLGVLAEYRPPDGGNNSSMQNQSEILSLKGTIPINFRGSWYNIPVSIRMPQGFPEASPPVCYVCPSEDLLLKPTHNVVDSAGKCNVPGFLQHDWRRGSLKNFIEELARQFSVNPPLYANPNPGKPAAATSPPAGASLTTAGSISRASGSYFPSVVSGNRPALTTSMNWPQLSSDEEVTLAAALASMGISEASSDGISSLQLEIDKLTAEDAALETEMYDAYTEFADNKVNLDTYLKRVRQLAVKQFFIRAKLNKIQPASNPAQKKKEELKVRAEGEEAKRKRQEAEERERKEEEERQRRQREEERVAAVRKREEDERKRKEEEEEEKRRRPEREKLAAQGPPPPGPPPPYMAIPYQTAATSLPSSSPPYGSSQSQGTHIAGGVPPPGPSTGLPYQSPGSVPPAPGPSGTYGSNLYGQNPQYPTSSSGPWQPPRPATGNAQSQYPPSSSTPYPPPSGVTGGGYYTVPPSVYSYQSHTPQPPTSAPGAVPYYSSQQTRPGGPYPPGGANAPAGYTVISAFTQAPTTVYRPPTSYGNPPSTNSGGSSWNQWPYQ